MKCDTCKLEINSCNGACVSQAGIGVISCHDYKEDQSKIDAQAQETIDAKALLVGAKIKFLDNPYMLNAINTGIEALMKQVPQSVVKNGEHDQKCPRCWNAVNSEYCPNCGQRLVYC